MAANDRPLLEITDLCATFHGEGEDNQVLDRVNLTINPGETVALAGESGSGKSVTALSILRLLDREAATITGRIAFDGRDLATLDEEEMRQVRGNRIAMIFQEPMTSLNPVYTVGSQIIESLTIHQGLSETAARRRAIELLGRTGIPDPDQRIDSFAHQLSGG
ncbi:MAG TPA: ATP-binding cassette domain-containing protein, partial [Desulfurivibrionaceae bacterium]|nr:ATP-binding cassette domain-containing protein [Desulfurivibrionaceae bacterium]